MPVLETRHWGAIEYESSRVIEFPAGLPAFEDARLFLRIEQPDTAPLVFLQSLTQPELVFISLPVEGVVPGYRLTLGAEETEALEMDGRGGELEALAIVTIRDGKVTANLMAPVVINRANQRAVQAIQSESGYSHQHRLGVRSCS